MRVANPPPCAKQDTDFQAVYTHQLFDDEKIRGYRGLRVEVYFAAGDLFTYFHVSYDQKHDTKFDDIEALLSSKMAPGSITKNLKTFKDVRKRSLCFSPRSALTLNSFSFSPRHST
jgi:histone acetyltransferase 1